VAEEELLVSIYLDADVERMIAKALRQRGYTCHAADEVGMKQASDEAQLEYAARMGYALVTYNVEHFAPLHARHLQKGWEHSGIVLIPKRWGASEVLRRLLKLLDAVTADEMCNSVKWLSDFA
jgi:hypothetical protein